MNDEQMSDLDKEISQDVFVPALGYSVRFTYTLRSAYRFALACAGWGGKDIDRLMAEYEQRHSQDSQNTD